MDALHKTAQTALTPDVWKGFTRESTPQEMDSLVASTAPAAASLVQVPDAPAAVTCQEPRKRAPAAGGMTPLSPAIPALPELRRTDAATFSLIKAIAKRIASAEPLTPDAALLNTAIDAYCAAYRSGSFCVLGTDAARLFVPAGEGVPTLRDVHPDDVPRYFAAVNPMATAIARVGMKRLLNDFPQRPWVAVYGPIGSGKSYLLSQLVSRSAAASGVAERLEGNPLWIEGGFLDVDTFRQRLVPDIHHANPARQITLLGMFASPDICAQRFIRRALEAHTIDPSNCRLFSSFMIGGYDMSRTNFLKWRDELNGRDHVSCYFFQNDAALEPIEPINLAAQMPASVTPQGKVTAAVVASELDAYEKDTGKSANWARLALGLPVSAE